MAVVLCTVTTILFVSSITKYILDVAQIPKPVLDNFEQRGLSLTDFVLEVMNMRADSVAILFKKLFLNQLPQILRTIWPTPEIQEWIVCSDAVILCSEVTRLLEKSSPSSRNVSHVCMEDPKLFSLLELMIPPFHGQVAQ